MNDSLLSRDRRYDSAAVMTPLLALIEQQQQLLLPHMPSQRYG